MARFTAYGVAVERRSDGRIAVATRIQDTATLEVVDTPTFVGHDIHEVSELIQQDLRRRVQAVDMDALTAAVVGRVLGTE